MRYVLKGGGIGEPVLSLILFERKIFMDLKDRLYQIYANEADCEKLADEIRRQIANDNCSSLKAGRKLIRAYLENDMNGMLNALCGWDMYLLVKQSFDEEM